VNDEQTDDEEPNANQDLEPAFFCLKPNFAGGSKKEHDRERVQAIHEPVSLGLRQRE
jgi:hypothetical protein